MEAATVESTQGGGGGGGLSRRAKLLLGVGGWLGLTIALGLIFGSDGKNDEFKPQEEFKLDAWIASQQGAAAPAAAG